MQAHVYRPTPVNLRRLANALQRGELVAIPTETVYGLAAHALDSVACKKIFTAKKRPSNDPLIVHVANQAQAEALAQFTPLARKVAAKFWPGPLTLVLPKNARVPGIVTSGGDTVAVRIPAHPIAHRLIELAGIPLAAPSANAFGYISPTEAGHVVDGLGKRIRYVLDGGPATIGVESTIVDLSHDGKATILRPGAITSDQLRAVLGFAPTIPAAPKRANDRKRQVAPGMLSRHYSPKTALSISTPPKELALNEAAIFVRRPKSDAASPANSYWLSERGSIEEIARNLYRVLREADKAGYRKIVIEPLPSGSGGLAIAINDRLSRAAAKR